jgi:hypothetical protein
MQVGQDLAALCHIRSVDLSRGGKGAAGTTAILRVMYGGYNYLLKSVYGSAPSLWLDTRMKRSDLSRLGIYQPLPTYF